MHAILTDVDYIVDYFEHDHEKNLVRTDESNALMRANNRTRLSIFLTDYWMNTKNWRIFVQTKATRQCWCIHKITLAWQHQCSVTYQLTKCYRTQRVNNELVKSWHENKLISTNNAALPQMYFFHPNSIKRICLCVRYRRTSTVHCPNSQKKHWKVSGNRDIISEARIILGISYQTQEFSKKDGFVWCGSIVHERTGGPHQNY